MLACKNLSVVIQPSGVHILDRATARFMPKGLNAVIGPSGCGKSTLAKAAVEALDSPFEPITLDAYFVMDWFPLAEKDPG